MSPSFWSRGISSSSSDFVLPSCHNALARADELFVLIVKAAEAMAADAALCAVQLFALIQNGRVLGDHVARVALLAAGLKILWIVERPEPVFVAAMPFLDGINGAAIAAMAGRASEFFERMPFDEIEIGMAGERRVLALGHAEVGLRERDLRWDIARIGAHVAGLAAIN